MKSIFDMTDEELEQLSELKNVRNAKTGADIHYIKYQEPNFRESFSFSNTISLNELQAVKRLINHEIEYLKKEEYKDCLKESVGEKWKTEE